LKSFITAIRSGEGDDLRQVGGDQQQRQPGARQLGDQLVERRLGTYVDADGRLVHDELTRISRLQGSLPNAKAEICR
jgi:hypothetical protein